MRTKTKVGGTIGGLAALLALVTAFVAFIAFVMVALAALVAVASAVVAYLKRDTWTLPAYRWTRDKCGRWCRTPWSADDGARTASAAPADKVTD